MTQTPEAPNPFAPPEELPPVPAQRTPPEPLTPGPWAPSGYGVPPQAWGPAPVRGPVPYWPYPVNPAPADPDALFARGMSAPVPAWPSAPRPQQRARRLTRLGTAIAAFATVVAAGLVLLQPSDDRAVSRSTGLTELMVPPALTAAEPVPEQPLSLAEMLLGRGPGVVGAPAAAFSDLEELLLRPGPRASSPTAGDAAEPSWWVVLRSGIEQPQ
jgi:hypothetical protein